MSWQEEMDSWVISHPLRRWLRDSGTTQVEFAEKIGRSTSWLSGVLKGRSRASYEALADIVRETGGAVTSQEIMNHSMRTPQPRAAQYPDAGQGASE